MKTLNKVTLIGRLGNDPEIRTFQDGGKVCNLLIATSEVWKDKNSGEKKEKTEWHKVVILNQGLIKVCENYLRKGSKVYIEGKLETRKYTDKVGNDAYTTEILIRPYVGTIIMLDDKKETQDYSELKEDNLDELEQIIGQNNYYDDEIGF